MSVLEFIKLIHCFFIKRAIIASLLVGPSDICFISLGSTKPVNIKVKADINYN